MKYSDLTSNIIKHAMTVHSILKCGYPEVIYQRAFEIELRKNNIPFQREFVMPIFYKDIHIGTRRVDFFVDNIISVEFKATSKLEPIHFNQALNYLEVSNLEIGLLINFGADSLEFNRLTNKKFKPNNDTNKKFGSTFLRLFNWMLGLVS